MARNLSYLWGQVTHALGGAPASQLSTTQIVNEAGRFLCSAHRWKFLERKPVTVKFRSGEDAIPLPPDCAEVLTVALTDGLSNIVHFSTVRSIEYFRESSATATNQYWVALNFSAPPNSRSAAPAPHLEIWPQPGNSTDGIRVHYRAGWRELSDADDVPVTPDWLDVLLHQVIRETAKGYEEDDTATLSQRMDVILGSVLFDRMKARDGSIQPTTGELQGGAAEMFMYSQPSIVSATSSAADPS